MRKAYRVKRRSCVVCHLNKRGHERRWKPREFHELRRVEYYLRERLWEEDDPQDSKSQTIEEA
jgi:hypothetical protein